MSKVVKATELRSGQSVKAGKKKIYQEPPALNPAKKEAKKAGQQQFTAREQLTVQGTQIVFDKRSQQFVTKIVAISVPFIYDENRKQFVYSPSKEDLSKEDSND